MDHRAHHLPRRADAAPQARDAVARALGHAPGPELALVVTELVANAVTHGRGPTLDLWVAPCPGGARVEVANAGPGFDARPRPASRTAESGRGLGLVDALARRWGAERDADGRSRVWAEVDLPAAA